MAGRFILFCAALMLVMFSTVAFAADATSVPPVATETPAVTTANTPATPATPAKPVEAAPVAPAQAEKSDATPPWAEIQKETVPRKDRWKDTEVGYLQANIHHPPLYYDSPTEKMMLNDAAYRSPAGVAGTTFYDICQFPVQLVLTPVLIFAKPFWEMERGQP